uniref:Uncharacterized protein n=1 Tax=Picea sitchensis TaxID=3332 RepID=D5AE10_PICSI|nr:unknown [Picea sitchensis]
MLLLKVAEEICIIFLIYTCGIWLLNLVNGPFPFEHSWGIFGRVTYCL